MWDKEWQDLEWMKVSQWWKDVIGVREMVFLYLSNQFDYNIRITINDGKNTLFQKDI